MTENSMRMRQGKFCVYQHLVDGKVVYVGKGVSSRPFAISDRNTRWREICRNGYEVEILSWFDTTEEALREESRLIRLLKPWANGRQCARDGNHTRLTIRARMETVDRLNDLSMKLDRSKGWIIKLALEIAFPIIQQRMSRDTGEYLQGQPHQLKLLKLRKRSVSRA